MAVTFGKSGKLWLWDLQTTEMKLCISTDSESPGPVSLDTEEAPRESSRNSYLTVFSPNGTRVATAKPGRSIYATTSIVQVWDSKTGEQLLHFDCHRVSAIAFTADGSALRTFTSRRLYKSGTGTTHVDINTHDLMEGDVVDSVPIFRAHPGEGRVFSTKPAIFSADGDRLAIGTPRGPILLLGQRKSVDDAVKRLEGHEEQVTALAFSTDSRYLASASEDDSFRIYDVTSRKTVLRQHIDSAAYLLAFSLDSELLATALGHHLGRRVVLWHLPSMVKGDFPVAAED